MMKFLNNKLFLIFFFSIFISSIAVPGPLDIKKIKKDCLRDFETENSSKYNKCVKDKIYKILNDEDKN